jgi:hypothetical protein
MTVMPGSARRIAVPLTLAALAACAGQRQDDARGAAACEPRPGPLAADAAMDALAGSFRLVMAATAGDSAGRTVEGWLHLQPNDSTLLLFAVPGAGAYRDVTTPLFGTADIELAGVHAYQAGALDAADPLAPGVLVLVRRPADAAPQVTLRLGAMANRRNADLLFDGGYAALRVTWIDGGAFGGGWESAVPNRLHSAGHFCAYAVR